MDSKHVLVESSTSVSIARYSLATPRIAQGIDHEIVVTSIVVQNKLLVPSC